jgi:hypothetical protein
MGTESSGGFNDIAISNCVIQQSSEREAIAGRPEGLAGIALEIVDGGTLERVTIDNIIVEGTTAPIFIRLGNRARPPQPTLPKPPVGELRDVSISNVVATGAGIIGCSITGLPDHPVENVTLSNIAIEFKGGAETWPAILEVPEVAGKYPECVMFGTLPAYGFFCRHADGLTLRDLRLRYTKADTRPAIVCDDVASLTVDGLVAEAADDASAQLVLSRASVAFVKGSIAAPDSTFLRLMKDCEDITLVGNNFGKAATPFVLDDGVSENTITLTGN